MAGTKAGGKKASATNKERHGEDFYQRIGRIGGENGHTGGFASDPELARRAGAIGGRKSRRGSGYIYKLYNTEGVIILEGNASEVADYLGYSYSTVVQSAISDNRFQGWTIRRERKN